ncbi:hypothetical protein V4V36_22085 [Paenibacillus lautus]|uniref:Hydrolase n=1 Tax=Paenibacillus lautus TaxID=1401 RepID=A0A385TJL3_PAELA|nr:hypothetical protein [Paenibacillus lautus]AYB42812.1 hypothetical protein D5F53_05730 [Paenibacillus lautus]MBY0160675.1 hypothetical protein [Cytobacillus firmus]MCI1773606.1 hypothetical protein [Paenibacillus lautus]VTR25324.1 Uncharacterised protein [Actinobacillus pleuropneumoniae]
METERYYISVQSKSIMKNQGDSPYELIIDATDQQVAELRSLFNALEDYDQAAMFRAPMPGIPYHHDSPNDGYDFQLKAIYRTLYNLGTEETKQHVSSLTDKLDTIG